MALKFLTSEAFRAAAGDSDRNADRDLGIYATMLDAGARAVDGERKVQFTISTPMVDRYGDIIEPNGWKIDAYLRNPMVLFNHDSDTAIGISDRVWVEDNKLKAIADFQPPEISRFADAVYRMLTHPKRFLRAASVGFIPLKWQFNEDAANRGGMIFQEQELVEWSVATVPANPDALSEAKSAGIDLAPMIEWAEKLLDGEGRTSLPRVELEALRKSIAPSRKLFVIESPTAISKTSFDRIRQTIDAWRTGETGALVLDCGLTLRRVDASDDIAVNEPAPEFARDLNKRQLDTLVAAAETMRLGHDITFLPRDRIERIERAAKMQRIADRRARTVDVIRRKTI